MWYLIVSTPDLCTLTYFVNQLIKKFWPKFKKAQKFLVQAYKCVCYITFFAQSPEISVTILKTLDAVFFCFLSADHFQKKKFSRISYHLCQTIWTQIRPDILSGLIWVQALCFCLFDLILYVPSTIFQL